MDSEGRGCLVCEVSYPAKPLICPSCTQKTVITDKLLWKLCAAKQVRDELEAKLAAALSGKEELCKQNRRLEGLRKRTTAARVQVQLAEQLRAKAAEEVKKLRARNAKREKDAKAALAKIEQQRREQEKVLQADVQQRLLHLHVSRSQVATELRKHVRVLLDILPLNLCAARPSSSRSRPIVPAEPKLGSPVVTICGYALPTSLAISSGTNQQKLSTALGNVTLLLEVLATLLGAPLVSRLQFKGSNSLIWVQRSFWDERPALHGTACYRLYYANAIQSPATPSGQAAISDGALSAIKQHWPWETAFKSAPSAVPSVAVTARRQKEDLAAAMHQLTRNIGALHSDQLLHFSIRLPQDWSPFAALAGLCMQLAAEPRSDGRRSLTASLAAPGLLAGGESTAFLDAFLLDGDQDDEEIDGWDLVQRPAGWSAASQRGRPDPLRMPPTPSEADEVINHWERAMITDSSGSRYRPVQPTHFSLGRHIAPLGQGALAAADKLWQGFRRGG